MATTARVMHKPTATMTRCAEGPVRLDRIMARLLVTFRADCDAAETRAAAKPIFSKVGAFQEAAAIPAAMGNSERRASVLGNAVGPSSKTVSSAVMMGMAHLEV